MNPGMKGQGFISPNMSLVLDLVRALAALTVLAGHMIAMDLYTGPFPFEPQMAHNAVVVFFVLSGLVIANSVQNRRTDPADYAIARAARIVPVAWFAVIASASLFAWSRAAGLPEGMMPPYDDANAATLLLPLFFLNESVAGQGLVWNPPYWSLAYEVWFYALFGAAIFLKGWNRAACIALFAVLAGWKILLMLPIWLMGAALVRHAGRLALPLRLAPALFGGGAVLCILADYFAVDAVFALRGWLGVEENVMGFSQFVLTDTLMGAGIAAIFVALRPVADRYGHRLAPAAGAIGWLAGSSFTLYLLHNPILLIFRGYGIGAGDNVAMFAAMFGFVVLVCGAIAPLVEHRSPQIRAVLRARFAPRAVAA